ncbi:foldase protein PrsA [Paenibacillaceae bacterium GAS479]|nr:foldase protein PrsA [Paenibacillaceae bacterium GAS479]
MIVLAVLIIMNQLPDEPAILPANAQSEKAETDDGLAAAVGNERISEDELAERLRKLYGESVLQTMMIRSALDQESAKGDLQATEAEVESELLTQMAGYGDEESFYREMKAQFGLSRDEVYEEAMYRLLMEKWMTKGIAVSEGQIDTYLEEHAAELRPAPQMHLRWIVSSSQEESQQLLDQLEAGKDFAELARDNSTHTETAELGGDLGVVEEGDPFLDPGAAEAAATLSPGEVSEPVEVEGGFALVQVLTREQPRWLDEELLRAEVKRIIALDEAGSLKEGEQRLLQQYGASVKTSKTAGMPSPSGSG